MRASRLPLFAMEFMYLAEEFIAKCKVKPDRSRVRESPDPNERGFQRLLTMFELKVRATLEELP